MPLASVFLMMGDIEGFVFVLLNCGETQLHKSEQQTQQYTSCFGQCSIKSCVFSMQSSMVIRASMSSRSIIRMNLQNGFEKEQQWYVLFFGKLKFASRIASFIMPSTGLSNGHVPNAIAYSVQPSAQMSTPPSTTPHTPLTPSLFMPGRGSYSSGAR